MTNIKRLYKATKFNLKFYSLQLLIFFLVAVLNIIIAAIVSSFSNGSSGSLDMMAIMWIALVGATGFFYYFKFLLINGYSRKNIFLICISALLVLSLCWALLTFLLMVMVNELNISMFNIFFLMYPQSGYGTIFLWLLATLSAGATLGLLITLILYRAGKKVRLGLIASCFLIVPVAFLMDLVAKGGFFKGLGWFFLKIFGFAQNTPNPFIFIATTVVISVLCIGGSFLLIRKAQIKEI